MTQDRPQLGFVEVEGRAIAIARHDTGTDAIVVLCHGFRGERPGPGRAFVRLSRDLAARDVSSLRFDQFGSGDSDGDFLDSRFDDWIATIRALAERERAAGRRGALLGQSMGASAALVAAADLDLRALVAWVPDAKPGRYVPDGSGFMEEGGQRGADACWEQAHAADVEGARRSVAAPVRLVFTTADEYVDAANRGALIAAAKPADEVVVHQGWPHSAWTWDRATDEIEATVRFLTAHLA